MSVRQRNAVGKVHNTCWNKIWLQFTILRCIAEEMLTSIFLFWTSLWDNVGLVTLWRLLYRASARKTHSIYQKNRGTAWFRKKKKQGRDHLSGVFDKAVFLKQSPFSFNRTIGNKDGKVSHNVARHQYTLQVPGCLPNRGETLRPASILLLNLRSLIFSLLNVKTVTACTAESSNTPQPPPQYPHCALPHSLVNLSRGTFSLR